MKKKLKDFCQSLGLDHVGIAPMGPYDELEERLLDRLQRGYSTGMEEQDIKKRIDPKVTMEDGESIIVVLFPYFTTHGEGANISKYTYPTDYHILAKDKLEEIGMFLNKEINNFKYQVFVDTGPLVDRDLARLAGLGYFGLNNHIITDVYGSYVFIGYIINNYPFEPDTPQQRNCIQCGACIEHCPGGALLGEFQMDPRKCLSFITQKKQDLTEQELQILRKNKSVFGCDICQDVCPHNKAIAYTPINEFKQDLMYSLNEEEIAALSNREFKKKYGNRAFSWRGKKVILRNFDVMK